MKVYDEKKQNEFEIKNYDWIFGVLGLIPVVRLIRAILANAFGVGSYFITLLISVGFRAVGEVVTKTIAEQEIETILLILILIVDAIVQGFAFSGLRKRNVLNDSNRFKILEE